jgi:hypothetical protein
MEELSKMMSIFLFPFYITDPVSYTNNNVKTDNKTQHITELPTGFQHRKATTNNYSTA